MVYPEILFKPITYYMEVQSALKKSMMKVLASFCVAAVLQTMLIGFSPRVISENSPKTESEPSVILQMYNSDTKSDSNTIFIRYNLINTGAQSINLSDVTIRYFYTIDGEEKQNFWCDWSTADSKSVTGIFSGMQVPSDAADYFFDTGFKESAGQLSPGSNVEIHLRLAKADWSNYIQTNDYSFNNVAKNYTDWNKAVVYINHKQVWGQEAAYEDPGDVPGEDPGDDPGENPGDDPGENPGDDPTEENNPDNLTAPLNIKAVPDTTSVAVTWEPVENAALYDVEADGDLISDIQANYYTHAGLEPNSTHTYKVRAKNADSISKWSTEYSVTTNPDGASQIKLQMYNSNRKDSTNSISPRLKLINTGDTSIKLSDIQIRYYYKVEGIETQNFWCDWSDIGAENVTGSFARYEEPKEGADYYMEVGFKDKAGELKPDDSAEMHIRFANTDWSDYIQSNDYSFNDTAKDYIDWDKAMVYIRGSLAWGKEPAVDVPAPNKVAARLQMYNRKTKDRVNTISPWFKLFNTGVKPIDLKDVRIRYYYTIDGNKEQDFWCDWTPIGSANVSGKFYKMPVPTADADYCLEMGFSGAAGLLIPGDDLEIQTRFAKEDWSDYSQNNDYSYNSGSKTYIDWDRVSVYVGNELVWGKELMLDVPAGLSAVTSETETTLSWDKIPGAADYDIEIDGATFDAGSDTSYTNTDLEPGTLHKYRVRAKSSINVGPWSEIIEKWTLPSIPTNVRITSKSNSILIEWDKVTGATGYDVEVQGSIIDNGSDTSYTHTGLNPNIQQIYRVRAKNASGTGKWSYIAAGSTLPGIPSNLKAAASEDSITLTWDAVAGATGYDIEADVSLISDIAGNSFTHTKLEQNTNHTYRVRSRNSAGISNWSEPLSVSTLLPAPKNITISVKSTEIKLAWDSQDASIEYDVEVDGAIKNNGVNTIFTHKELSPGSEHTYRVRARSGDITSLWSNEITGLTLPAVPGNVLTTVSNNDVTVSWDPTDGAEGYELEADGAVVNNGAKTTYIHAGLASNSSHTYRVRAYNASGAGEWSEMLTVYTAITAPKGLMASATSTTIILTWEPVDGVSGYDLLADGEILDMGTNTAFTVTGLEPNSVHVYRVRSKKDDRFSGWSGAVVKSTMVGVPSGFRAISTSNTIILLWSKVEAATKYELVADGRCIDLEAKATSYTDSGLEKGTGHSYRIRAGNANGMGDWSEIIRKGTLTSAPKNFKAEAALNEITLTWDACVDATGYEIDVNGTIAEPITGLEYIHTGLEPNTRQVYRVRAVFEDGYSEWSEKLEVNTKPELILKVAKDTVFNFVVVAPAKKEAGTRTITVIYNSDELEVIDLCANTPKTDISPGMIEGMNITVSEFSPGKIVYRVNNADKTVVNMIRFISKTNDNSRVSYVIE